MMDWRVVPIDQGHVRTPEAERKSHNFRQHRRRKNPWTGEWGTVSESGVNWTKTVELLERELEHLGASNVLLQMDVEEKHIRKDGWIYANASPDSPAVVLTFDSDHGPLSYPCDTFTDWQANVRAIALALEALRKVDRYGVGRFGEQYKGWKALPAAGESSAGIDDPWATLAKHSGWDEDVVRLNPKKAWLVSASKTHPDRGGRREDWDEAQAAARALGVE